MRELNLVLRYLLLATTFLLPIFFLPITQDFFEFNKLVLLSVATTLGVLVWALANSRGDFKFRTTPLDLQVVAFAAVVSVSAFMSSGNKLDAFVFPGLATQVLSLT